MLQLAVTVRPSRGIGRSAGEIRAHSRPDSCHHGRSLPPPIRAITAWSNSYGSGNRSIGPWTDRHRAHLPHRGELPLWGAPVAVQARRRTGVWIFTLAIPFPASLPTGKSRISPGSLAIHPVTLRRSTTPDDPLRLAISGASGAAPTRLTMKASSFTDFEAARRFVTCCLRFTTGVAARHARLASGWRAAPLPGGSRTHWIATRGFRSSHPPPQGFPWRNNRSAKPGWRRRSGGSPVSCSNRACSAP